MLEQIFELSEHTDPLVFFGVNNVNLHLLKNLFPHVRMVGRGRTVKIEGEEEKVNVLLNYLQKIEKYCIDNNSLNEEVIIQIVKGSEPAEIRFDHLILHGVNGKSIMARTANQQKLVKDFSTHDLLF